MISVCIALHNGGDYIIQQINSILPQLSEDDEVIISDDGSSDNSVSLIEALNDKRIIVLSYHQEKRSIYSHWYVKNNFENALIHARGDIIFLSDQDDLWLPDKVSICLHELKSCDLVIHNIRVADGELNDMGRNIYDNGFRFRNYLMMEGTYFGCAMAFKRRILDASLPFPKKLLVHDIWIGLIAETTGIVHYIDKPLILYRLRDESVSHAVKNPLWLKLGYRFYTLTHLLLRAIKNKFSNL